MLAKNGIMALRRAKRRNMERYVFYSNICQETVCAKVFGHECYCYSLSSYLVVICLKAFLYLKKAYVDD